MASETASESAVDQVRAALTLGEPIARKTIEHALREAFGMSARQAKRFAAQGLGALGDNAEDELAERLEALERVMKL